MASLTNRETGVELNDDLAALIAAKKMEVIEAVGRKEEELCATELKSFAENTKATRAELLDDLLHCRRRGYAKDWKEGRTGIRCVAEPILDAYQRPVEPLTVMSPTMRLPQKRFSEFGQLCTEAAARVRKELLS